MQDSASFWTDIKNLEEQLAKSPDSYCFARLADVYLKVGLVDDALHVARQGTMKHPSYLSGHRSLSLACHAKGLYDEAIVSLKLVTGALPEDVPSQKLLGRLYAEAGNIDDACQAFRTALEFAPDDVECRIELESLEKFAESADLEPAAAEDEEEIIEDLELLEEIDVLEEDQPESESLILKNIPEYDTPGAAHHDPLSTGTLAELYVSQGFIHKALDIYRAILIENPADRITAARVAELEEREAVPAESCHETDYSYEEEAVSTPAYSVPSVSVFQETAPGNLPESDVMIAVDFEQTGQEVSRSDINAPLVLQSRGADKTLATLEEWLENIRRIKLCC